MDNPENPEHQDDEKSRQQFSLYPPTRHSLIQKMQDSDPHVSRLALETLLNIYEKPVRLFLCQKLRGRDEALDLAQSFWEIVLETNPLKKYEGQGKFQNFLIGCLNMHIKAEHQKQNAIKRGGSGRRPESEETNPDSRYPAPADDDSKIPPKAEMLSMDAQDWSKLLRPEERASLINLNTPSDDLERAWEMAALRVAVEDVRSSWNDKKQKAIFDALLQHIQHGEHGDLKTTAARLKEDYDHLRQMKSALKKDLRAALAWWE